MITENHSTMININTYTGPVTINNYSGNPVPPPERPPEIPDKSLISATDLTDICIGTGLAFCQKANNGLLMTGMIHLLVMVGVPTGWAQTLAFGLLAFCGCAAPGIVRKTCVSVWQKVWGRK